MKKNTVALSIMLPAILFLVLASSESEAHFGSKGPHGGSVSCMTVNDTVVYFGTYTGGVYESTTPQLVAWRPRPVGLKSGKINAIVHTGSYLFAATDSGIYRFTGFIGNDRYWEKVNNGIINNNITSLCAIDSITVLAGSDGEGVYLTSDKGASWDTMNTNLHHPEIYGLVKAGSRIIQIGEGGVWATDNNAASWFDYNDLNTEHIAATAVSYNAMTDELLLYNTGGLFRLQAASTTGTPVYNTAGTGLPATAVVRSISNNGTVWYLATDHGVYTSPSGSINWTDENTGIGTQDLTSIVAFPARHAVVAGALREGLFKAPDSLLSWTSMNSGFNNLVTYSMIAKDTLLVVAATEKGVFVSKNLATSYSNANNGLTDSLHVNDLTFLGTKLIAATQSAGIFVSADTGATWTAFNNNLTSMDIRRVKSSDNYAYLFNAAGEIFQSDLLSGWTMIQGGLPAGVNPTSMAFLGGNVFLGTYGDGFYYRPETGGSWTQGNSGLSNLNVTSVSINNHNKVLAGTDGNGVFVSDASAISWTATAPLVVSFTTAMGLDGSRVQDMAYYAGYVFASFRGAVLASHDDGLTWIEAGTQFNFPTYADAYKLSFVTTRIFTTTPNNSLYSNGLSELPPMGVYDMGKNSAVVTVIPNPNNGKFRIQYGNLSGKILEAAIVDAAGKTVKKFNALPVNEISLDCAKGFYFFRVITDKGVQNQKLIIQ